MKVLREKKSYELQGGNAWTENRFNILKLMNPKGKVVIVETDGKREKYLVPIGDLEVKPKPLHY